MSTLMSAREGDEEAREEDAGDAEHGRDRVRNRRRDLFGSRLHVLGSPLSPSQDSSVVYFGRATIGTSKP
jgi:hypothetical protein